MIQLVISDFVCTRIYSLTDHSAMNLKPFELASEGQFLRSQSLLQTDLR